MSLVLLLVAAFWATPTCLAQQVAYPPGVYGMWPTVVLNTSTGTLVTQDISNGVKCSVTSGIEKCMVTTTTCMPTTTDNAGYTGQLLLANGPKPDGGAGGVVGILLEVLWTSVDTGSTAPSYNWSAMDELLIEAQLCGLPVALSLDMPLASLPPWVVQQLSPNGGPIQIVNLDTSNTNFCPKVPPGSPPGTPSPPCLCPTGIACLCPNVPTGSPCSLPVFWNTTFNTDRMNFIKAAADHIYTSGLLSSAVQQNIVAVVAQPFGAATDDWNIPHANPDGTEDVMQVTNWQKAGYTTSTMLAAGQMTLNAAADNFPTQNLKLPIQVDLDIPHTGTDAGLATQVLDWAYGASSGFSGRFFAQLNFVNATKSPPDGTCPPDATQTPCSLFNLIGQYQPQVGLQDVAAAVDGFEDSCQQNGGSPCTPCDSPPVQYVCVSQSTWARVVQTYTPRFWEISRGDATTMTGPNNTTANGGCPITVSGQAAMRAVFSIVTTQMEESVPMASAVPCDEISVTATGLAYSRVSRTFNGTVTIQNISSDTIYGPFQVLSAALTSGVTLENATGTFDGTQYVTVPNASSLAPGQTATAAVQFNNPAFVTINFTPVVYSGSL